MMPSSTSSVLMLRKASRALTAWTFLLVLFGLIKLGLDEQLLGYLLIVVAAVIPAILWIRGGAQGIPVLPAISLMYIVYYALPIVRGDGLLLGYSTWEILRAAATVSTFLVACTIVWRWLTVRVHPTQGGTEHETSDGQLVPLIFVGFAAGAVFYLAVLSGWIGLLGSFFGLARSVAMSFTTVACYFLGFARAKGVIRGQRWVFAVSSLAVIIILNWGSLFLVGGIMYLLALALGYIIAAKRVSLFAVTAALMVLFVLHAGKGDMREKYWKRASNSVRLTSAIQVPELMVEWFETGFSALFSGTEGQNFIDRASLLNMLLRVQRLTPDHIEYLEGESYTLLPRILMPRFLNPDKMKSQASMDRLNIRYGILTVKGTAHTAIGWGLIAEAYANFGYFSVIGVALFVGALAGAMTRWSTDTPAISLSTLLAIETMMTMINLEADMTYMLMNLWVSSVSVLFIFGLFRLLVSREKRLVFKESKL